MRGLCWLHLVRRAYDTKRECCELRKLFWLLLSIISARGVGSVGSVVRYTPRCMFRTTYPNIEVPENPQCRPTRRLHRFRVWLWRRLFPRHLHLPTLRPLVSSGMRVAILCHTYNGTAIQSEKIFGGDVRWRRVRHVVGEL
jgi:hypothetical protein